MTSCPTTPCAATQGPSTIGSRLRSWLSRPCRNRSGSRTLILITTEHMGRGDDELGGRLMLNLIKTLPDMEPWRVILVNGGVKMVTDAHPCHPPLAALADHGVDILACSTCLEHFGLLDAQVVGQPTTMMDIVSSMGVADKVITL